MLGMGENRMSMYTDTYSLGSTISVVGLSAAAAFIPPVNCNGVWFKINSGAGTLYIGSGISQIPGVTMYPVSLTEIVSASGPARFFFYAASATMTVSVGMSFSRGLSAVIAGGG